MTTTTTDDLTRHRAPGALAYLAVWLALVVLATVTLFASRAVTGGWGLLVAFAIAGTKAVLVGWPVVGDTPTRALAELRLSCAECGVVHRYGDDPDVYMVIGDVAGVPAADAAQGVRRELAAVPQNVPLSADDLSLVTYVDTALPRESTSWRPLTTDEP